MLYRELLQRYPIISDQVSRDGLGVVLRELETVLTSNTPGDIVELGCYIGTSTLFIRRLLDTLGPDRQLYAYDSFEGLPPKVGADNSAAGDQFQGGELAVTKKQFLREFYKAGLTPPHTRKAWFNGLTPDDLPSNIAFAFLDGDFYESILDSLKLVWPKMTPGSRIVIDDFRREALPGVERAVQDFFQGRNLQLKHEQGMAVITVADRSR